jgi:hypothetical protein
MLPMAAAPMCPVIFRIGFSDACGSAFNAGPQPFQAMAISASVS